MSDNFFRVFDLVTYEENDSPEYALEFTDFAYGAYTVNIINLPDKVLGAMDLPIEEAERLLEWLKGELG